MRGGPGPPSMFQGKGAGAIPPGAMGSGAGAEKRKYEASAKPLSGPPPAKARVNSMVGATGSAQPPWQAKGGWPSKQPYFNNGSWGNDGSSSQGLGKEGTSAGMNGSSSAEWGAAPGKPGATDALPDVTLGASGSASTQGGVQDEDEWAPEGDVTPLVESFEISVEQILSEFSLIPRSLRGGLLETLARRISEEWPEDVRTELASKITPLRSSSTPSKLSPQKQQQQQQPQQKPQIEQQQKPSWQQQQSQQPPWQRSTASSNSAEPWSPNKSAVKVEPKQGKGAGKGLQAVKAEAEWTDEWAYEGQPGATKEASKWKAAPKVLPKAQMAPKAHNAKPGMPGKADSMWSNWGSQQGHNDWSDWDSWQSKPKAWNQNSGSTSMSGQIGGVAAKAPGVATSDAASAEGEDATGTSTVDTPAASTPKAKPSMPKAAGVAEGVKGYGARAVARAANANTRQYSSWGSGGY